MNFLKRHLLYFTEFFFRGQNLVFKKNRSSISVGNGIGMFEGERVPVATPEKALLDWCWLAEETGLDPRLDEMEWDTLDVEELDRLATETGVLYRSMLPLGPASHHDQARLRAEAIARLR